MITIYGAKTNRAMRVLWAAHELGIEFEHEPYKAASDELKAINPSGKSPAAMVDGVLLTDSVAIMAYLADKSGALTFPAGSIERAQMDGHIQFILDEVDALLWMAARHSFILPEEHRVAGVKDSLKWEFETSLQRLEARIQGPWLMGETFTIADILAIHCLNWAFVAKFPPASERLRDYAKAGRKRPAYIAATAD